MATFKSYVSVGRHTIRLAGFFESVLEQGMLVFCNGSKSSERKKPATVLLILRINIYLHLTGNVFFLL